VIIYLQTRMSIHITHTYSYTHTQTHTYMHIHKIHKQKYQSVLTSILWWFDKNHLNLNILLFLSYISILIDKSAFLRHYIMIFFIHIRNENKFILLLLVYVIISYKHFKVMHIKNRLYHFYGMDRGYISSPLRTKFSNKNV